MLINQHNYEEFFLLYADGELSAADKQAVEQFAQANPGLRDELEILQRMKLPDEVFSFDDKHSLYRYAANEISLNNYEEHFLLYVDDEPDTASKEKVETFVLQHPALQESFTLLKQTRLQAETIIFPGKESLYKKETRVRPVFYLQWMAVAAAVIGMVVLARTLFPAETSKQTIAKLSPVINGAGQHNTGEPGNGLKSKPPPQILTAMIAGGGKTVTPKEPIARNSVIQPSHTEVKKREPTGLLAVNTPVTNNSVLKREAIVTNPAEAAEQIPATQQLPLRNNTMMRAEMVKLPDSEEMHTTNNLVQLTVYKELDTNDDDKSLYLGSIEINKDKLRGFFRKAGSLFRGKAKQEDEKTEHTNPSNTRILK
ncbi:MAG: hypothetical protein Q8R50_03380 [Sediminibacterium sp.]|nr:hypothetical protein [Sediminibacterium sp.]